MNYRNAVVLLAFALAAPAAELSVGSAALSADKPAALHVTLASGGAALTGIQFELEYDAKAVEVTVEAGQAATDAGKTLQSSPIGAGKRRVIIVGFNQNGIADGVVATIQVSLKDKATPGGDRAVRILAPVGTNRQGQSVPVTGRDGGVKVEAR